MNKKIIKNVENRSPTDAVAEFIKRLMLFEESDSGNHRWKDAYLSEVEKYYLKGGGSD